MATVNEDPDPAETPGLEAGGGVAPGDTPPVTGSTGAPSHAPPQRGLGIPVAVASVFGVLVVLFIVVIVLYLTGVI